jgi:hypothetical protein
MIKYSIILLYTLLFFWNIPCVFIYFNSNIFTKNKNKNLILDDGVPSIVNINSSNIISKMNNKEKYCECIIQYYNINKELIIEKWLFNYDILYNKNAIIFENFLKINMGGEIKEITITNRLNNINNKNCIECKIISDQYVIPLYDNNNQIISTERCMNIEKNMNIMNININTFCKNHIFKLDEILY